MDCLFLRTWDFYAYNALKKRVKKLTREEENKLDDAKQAEEGLQQTDTEQKTEVLLPLKAKQGKLKKSLTFLTIQFSLYALICICALSNMKGDTKYELEGEQRRRVRRLLTANEKDFFRMQRVFAEQSTLEANPFQTRRLSEKSDKNPEQSKLEANPFQTRRLSEKSDTNNDDSKTSDNDDKLINDDDSPKTTEDEIKCTETKIDEVSKFLDIVTCNCVKDPSKWEICVEEKESPAPAPAPAPEPAPTPVGVCYIKNGTKDIPGCEKCGHCRSSFSIIITLGGWILSILVGIANFIIACIKRCCRKKKGPSNAKVAVKSKVEVTAKANVLKTLDVATLILTDEIRVILPLEECHKIREAFYNLRSKAT